MQMSKQDKNVSIDFFGGLAGVMIILAILSVIGEPDLLDQIIAIAKNYSETIKCNN
jgi:lantibiotic modifying enzyme